MQWIFQYVFDFSLCFWNFQNIPDPVSTMGCQWSRSSLPPACDCGSWCCFFAMQQQALRVGKPSQGWEHAELLPSALLQEKKEKWIIIRNIGQGGKIQLRKCFQTTWEKIKINSCATAFDFSANRFDISRLKSAPWAKGMLSTQIKSGKTARNVLQPIPPAQTCSSLFYELRHFPVGCCFFFHSHVSRD